MKKVSTAKTEYSSCCNAKVVFNNATGDEVCSLCRLPIVRLYWSDHLKKYVTIPE